MKPLNIFKNFVIFSIIAAASLWPGADILAQDKNPAPKRVLAIFVFKKGMPGPYRLEESLRAVLAANSSYPIELDVEYADQSRFPEKRYLSKIIDLYRYKYSKQKMDLVLVMGDESVDLMLEYGEALFGDIPVVLITADRKNLPRSRLKPNMVSVEMGFDFGKTGSLIQDLLPKTKNLFVVSGTSLTDRKLKDLTVEALAEFDGRFAIQYLDDLSLEDLLLKVARLPKDSVIFYLTLFRDANGQSFVPRDIVAEISEKANAPTFGIMDLYLGHGIVGGNLLSAGNQGKRYAEIVVKTLKGEPLTNSKFMGKGNQMMFDWRQLKRWSIDEDRLPAGSIVRYREPSIWADHKWEIVGVIVIIFAQALALLGLIIQHQKRRRAELAAKRHREELAHVARRATLGEVTASLAHELNQPLTAILSSAQAARRFLNGPDPDLNRVSTILDHIAKDDRRAGEIIRRLRALLSKGELQVKTLNINQMIREGVTLMKSYGAIKNTSIVMELAADLPAIRGDEIQLQQVMLNLVLNGYEAMRAVDHGSLKLIIATAKHNEKMVKVSVRDAGHGLDPEDLDRIFEPYHTTKPEGLGMGLSISRSIIEAHEGQLWAENNPDRGVTVYFTVPVSKQME